MGGEHTQRENGSAPGVNQDCVTIGLFRDGPSSFSQVLVGKSGNAADMIGLWLRRSGKDQRDLARALNIEDGAVSRMLNGKRKISADEFLAAIRFIVAEAS